MTLYADASALVARHLDVPARSVALETFGTDPVWCTSAVALTEALALIDRLTDDLEVREELEPRVMRPEQVLGRLRMTPDPADLHPVPASRRGSSASLTLRMLD